MPLTETQGFSAKGRKLMRGILIEPRSAVGWIDFERLILYGWQTQPAELTLQKVTMGPEAARYIWYELGPFYFCLLSRKCSGLYKNVAWLQTGEWFLRAGSSLHWGGPLAFRGTHIDTIVYIGTMSDGVAAHGPSPSSPAVQITRTPEPAASGK